MELKYRVLNSLLDDVVAMLVAVSYSGLRLASFIWKDMKPEHYLFLFINNKLKESVTNIRICI